MYAHLVVATPEIIEPLGKRACVYLCHVCGDPHLASLSQRSEDTDMADKQLQHTHCNIL